MLIPEGDYEKGRKVFKRLCATCHNVSSTTTKTGPTLNGVLGQKSGAITGFDYSVANTNMNVTWTQKNLSEYLKDPKFFIPGTKMDFDGIEKEQERADVITYIAEQMIQPANDRIEISTEVVEIKPWINGLKYRKAVAAALMVFVITYSEILPGQFRRKIVYVYY
ncbi:Cytochrome c type-1 [Aphelenchoides besseyi]|nr:Cytochrome c type-1 [Aphelenchoides besseyi]KAI6211899.1 Cytochrome c type-1 [Aphelenchoides besseyi]